MAAAIVVVGMAVVAGSTVAAVIMVAAGITDWSVGCQPAN